MSEFRHSGIYHVCSDFNEEKKKVPQYLVDSAKALAAALKSWTHKRDVSVVRNTAPCTQ